MILSIFSTGSKGNCYLIKNDNLSIMIDAGISKSKSIELMDAVADSNKYLFITHEHDDHVKGLSYIMDENTKLYTSEGSYRGFAFKNNIAESDIQFITPHTHVLSSFNFIPIQTYHDAIEPYSFVFEVENERIGILTDTGSISHNILKAFKECTTILIESNYDEKMLSQGSYPQKLKTRISSNTGHLSNIQAMNFLEKISIDSPNLKNIFLVHISDNSNSPQIIDRYVEYYANTYGCNVYSCHQGESIIDFNLLGGSNYAKNKCAW